MTFDSGSRQLPHDWYPGTIPPNVCVCNTAYLGTSYSFQEYRSTASIGLRIGRGASLCDRTVLDVGPNGQVSLGDYALVSGARIICDSEVEIGDYALIGWNVVIMDNYRVPVDVAMRRHELERSSLRPRRRLENECESRPVRIGRNVWIGFETCVLPGVIIGEGSIVGARSVVTENVPPFTVIAGNPARIVGVLDH
jgi:carbonic anhydrase/acetyltransferase-like protein (isoleucine patch superfamily)